MASRPLFARRPLIGGVVPVSIAAMIILGVRYAGTRGPGRLDQRIDRRVESYLAGHPRALVDLINLANPATMLLGSAALCMLFILLHRWRLAFYVVLGPAICTALVDVVLKPLFDRRLAGGLSFPSGHTAAASALALVVIVAVVGPNRPSWPAAFRVIVVLVAVAFAIAVAVALIGGGYHYATDTVGGFLVAIASVLSVGLLIDAIAGQPRGESYVPTHTRRPDAELLPTVKA